MTLKLSASELKSVKVSYFNLYSLFLNNEVLTKEIVYCFFKWGIQLKITEEELKLIFENNSGFKLHPKEEALEQVFFLVYIIYLDGIVEDTELLIASKYAERLGFKPHIVGDLLKALVTAPYDGLPVAQVRKELSELLKHSDY